jgi:hypothetical protein
MRIACVLLPDDKESWMKKPSPDMTGLSLDQPRQEELRITLQKLPR